MLIIEQVRWALIGLLLFVSPVAAYFLGAVASLFILLVFGLIIGFVSVTARLVGKEVISNWLSYH